MCMYVYVCACKRVSCAPVLIRSLNFQFISFFLCVWKPILNTWDSRDCPGPLLAYSLYQTREWVQTVCSVCGLACIFGLSILKQTRLEASNEPVLQCVAVCCSVMQSVAACCSVSPRTQWASLDTRRRWTSSALQCVAVCCSVLL